MRSWGAWLHRGISVTGVTKATLGSPEIARVWLRAGVTGLGDSRVENLHALRAASITAPTDAHPLAHAHAGRCWWSARPM